MNLHPDVASRAAALHDRYPRFRLVATEASTLMRTLAVVVRLWNPSFLTDTTVTIGWTVHMPSRLAADATGARVLRHEGVHLEQFRRHGVWFLISYLLVLPAGITMRARWEMEAYIETMRDELEASATISDATVRWIEDLFTGPTYLFMDVRKQRVRRRLLAERARLLTGNVGAGS